MALGDGIYMRLEQLARAGAHIPDVIRRNQRIAAQKAVEVATEQTPPTDNTPPRGVGATTGETKAAWQADSQTEPIVSGEAYTVVLANNKQHISHLNYGFRMDQHFVPGLIMNPYTGLLDKVDPSLGGITVGTQTTYVPGLYMREQAIQAYRGSLEEGLQEELRGLFDNEG